MTLAIVAGIVWATLAILISLGAPGFIALAAGLLAFAITFALPNHSRALLALLSSALVLSGTSLWVQTELTKPNWVVSIIEAGESHELELKILNRPKEIFTNFAGDPIFGVSVSLEAMNGQRASARGYLLYENQQLERGQIVSLSSKLEEPGKNARDSFSINTMARLNLLADADSSQGFLNELRREYIASLQGVSPDSKALVGGLAIGDTTGLSAELEEKMLTVSLSHLVAVSGSNCAIVVGMVYLIAVRLGFGRFGRTVVSLAALFAYVLLIGPDPSVLRAAVMSASVIVLISLGRRSIALNGLSIAGLILLIADPWLAVEFGFGLSLSATAGILLLAPAIYEKLSLKMPKVLALGLSVTISAQLFCLPLLMQLQPGLPTYAVIANLLAGPVVAPVTVLGMVAVVLTPMAPLLAGSISWVASLGTWLIEQIALFFSELPVASFPWLTGIPAAALSVLLILAISAWLRANTIALKQLGVAGVIVIAVATTAVPAASEILPKNWPINNWTFVACDVGQGDALVIKSLGRIAVIDVGRDPLLVDSCLVELGINRIDLLVLTHFDFDHVGGLSGALNNRKVNTALLSGFPDDRPATEISKQLLTSAGASVVIADPSISGTLGDYFWKVLSPTRKATEAEDSNDASVVLMFRSSELDILLLGDLGLRGQTRIEKYVLRELQQSKNPLILKVSHHGSNDQLESLHLGLNAEIGVLSVGEENGYGHPGKELLEILSRAGTQPLRTDNLGSIAIATQAGILSWAATG